MNEVETIKGIPKRSRGRPRLPDYERKKHRTIKLTDEIWEDLAKIGGGNRANAIEDFVNSYWEDLKLQYKK